MTESTPDLAVVGNEQRTLDFAPASQPLDLGQPSAADIRAALDPVFNKIALCVASDMAPPGKLELRFRIAPTGEVTGAKLAGMERANECVWNVVKLLHFKSWNGGDVAVAIPLERTGLPAAAENVSKDAH